MLSTAENGRAQTTYTTVGEKCGEESRAFPGTRFPERRPKLQRKLEAGLECVPILHFVVVLLFSIFF